MEAGRLPQSAALLEAVVADHADYAEAFNVLGVAFSRMGQHARAQAAFRRVIELDPTSATAYENLGVDALAQGDLPGALDQLTHALALDPRLARAHNAVASTYQRMSTTGDCAVTVTDS